MSRARLTAACNAITDVSSKRRQKSPAVVGSGNAACPQGVEEHPVASAQLDVVQALPAAQNVVGDVQNMVRLEVRPVHLQQLQRRVDLARQVDRGDQLGDQAHPPMG